MPMEPMEDVVKSEEEDVEAGRVGGDVGGGMLGEPAAETFSSSMGDGRLPKGLVGGGVWLLTRADISRASFCR